MKYFTHTRFLKVVTYLGFASSMVIVSFFFQAHSASAQIISLDVCTLDGFCDSESLSVPEGEQVEISWYIDGYEDCRLFSNSVFLQNIDTSVLPAIGSTLFTPSSDQTSTFSIDCDGVVEVVEPPPPLSVDIEIAGSDTKTFDPDLPGVAARVNWDSTSATRCDPWYMAPVDDPGNQTTLPIQYDNWDVGKTSGVIWFDLPIDYIQVSTIFSITCYNDDTGEVLTDTDTLTVLDPGAPVALSTSLDSGGLLVSADPLVRQINRDAENGYAYTTVYSNVSNAGSSVYDRRCYYNAYLEDGTPIPNPPNFGTSATNLNRTFSGVTLTETTRLEMVCKREEVVYESITYPTEWSTSTVLVEVADGGYLPLEGSFKQVTVTIEPLPVGDLTVEKNPYTGYAYKEFYVRAENAEYCSFEAYLNPDNTSLINLDAWSAPRRYTNSASILDGFYGAPDLTQDTNFVVKCQRSFDRNYFATNTPEYEAAYAEATVRITVLEAPTLLDEPEIRMYANPIRVSASDIWSQRTANNGFGTSNHNTRTFGNSQTYISTGVDSVPKSITFPFGYNAGEYDIHFAHCDEADGDSFYRLLVNGTEVGGYTADAPYQEWDGCGHLEYFYGDLGYGIDLSPGDDITLECTPDGDERCRVNSLVFAQGGPKVIDRQPGETVMNVDIFYNSKYTKACRNHYAYPAGEPATTWSGGSTWRDLWSVEQVSTSTLFTAECYRNDSSVPADGQIEIIVPQFVSFSATVEASAGECRLIEGGPYVTAPPGTIANTSVPIGDPSYGLCIPAADLGMLSPSPSELSVNNVTGTYDIRALLALTNHGPGALPDTSEVAYYASTELELSVPYYAAYVARYGDASDETSPAPLYGDGIAEPVDPTDYSNPREVTINDVVFRDVPFGTHTMCSRVNIASDYADPSDALVEPDLNPVDGNQDLANNVPSCTTYTLEVPEPPMNLTANPTIVRGGQGVELQWDINITYQMDCSINGPAGANDVADFNTLTVGPGYVDSAIIGPLSATSEFTFTCTEDLTNTTFTRSVTVEVVPDFEEI